MRRPAHAPLRCKPLVAFSSTSLQSHMLVICAIGLGHGNHFIQRTAEAVLSLLSELCLIWSHSGGQCGSPAQTQRLEPCLIRMASMVFYVAGRSKDEVNSQSVLTDDMAETGFDVLNIRYSRQLHASKGRRVSRAPVAAQIGLCYDIQVMMLCCACLSTSMPCSVVHTDTIAIFWHLSGLISVPLRPPIYALSSAIINQPKPTRPKCSTKRHWK